MHDYIIDAENIRLVKPKVVLEILEKMDKLIESERKKKSWEERRFIVGFLFWTGLRVSEALEVRRQDIDLINKLLYATTLKQRRKNVKNTIPLNHVPARELRYWDDYMTKRKIGPNEHVIKKTRQGVWAAVKTTFEKFGYKNIHPHMLRHSIAVFLVTNGLTLNAVQRFLRHSKAENTAIYFRITGQDLSPLLEKIRKKIEYGQLTLI